ncbi:outer membrane protein [Bartonella gabonensis]|uniref:outer membrane protein n=1 Tax=Bartonella gabonensis TaxID=2699889 RepID=UPI00158E80B7|nr:porin [Bartonella gabonensis]
MNTKRLITASIFSLVSASTALAADVQIPHQPALMASSSTIVAPTFSWTGLYLGVQAGGFSSKSDMAIVSQEKSFSLDKEFSPNLSGFVGGFYAGSNIDLGDSFIFGVDTDLTLSGKKHTKTITIGASDNATVENAVGRFRRSAPTPPPTTTTVSETNGTPSQPAASQSSQAATGQSSRSAATGSVNSTKSIESVSVELKAVAPTLPSSQKSSALPAGQPASSKTEMRSVQSSARTGVGGASANRGNGLQPPAPEPTSSSTGGGTPRLTPSLAGSNIGEQSSAVVSSVPNAPAKLVPTQKAENVSVSSTTSTRSESVKTTSAPSSAAERTVPTQTLVLSRSGASNSGTGASNGTSEAKGHNGSSHGSGSSNPHVGSHAGGHGSSSANPHGANPHVSRSHGAQIQQAADKNDAGVYGIEQMKKMASELGLNQEDEVETLNHTFKQNWSGATRVRIGFAADRFMPYLAGGIAYGQFQDTVSISVKNEDGRVVSSKNLTDETKTMIGYTLGGGVDFSVLDNVIVRAEYRYSDFGKKKFAKEKLEIDYKTNDFRVGVAYKF